MSNEVPIGKRLCRLLLVKLPLSLIALSLVWVLVLKWCPVLVTPLMVQRSIAYRSDKEFRTRKVWKPYREISPELARAVIASEDNLFEKHHGFDFKAIKDARREAKDGKRVRGASTISQQTAKNVFLLPHRNLVRKGLEAYFTVLIEAIWGKERILEVYLNVAEMGKGVYGAEAAARYHFDIPASELTRSPQTQCKPPFFVCFEKGGCNLKPGAETILPGVDQARDRSSFRQAETLASILSAEYSSLRNGSPVMCSNNSM